MPAANVTSSQNTNLQSYIFIGLGILLCLAAVFLLGGSSTSSAGVTGGYGGYSAYAGGSAGGGLAPLFSWPRLLLLSIGVTLVTVGFVSSRRDA